MNLSAIFDRINSESFDGMLERPSLTWNSRLRSSAGRFIPGRRKFIAHEPPKIEVASYLRELPTGLERVIDTVAHEMIHYWLWVRRRPYGHTPEFYEKMKEMGVSRYNPVPKTRPYRYLYVCTGCQKNFPARKKLRKLACASCCRVHSEGKFDARFLLKLLSESS
jgi:predicted SprT family Zn-dependent metalloprotease